MAKRPTARPKATDAAAPAPPAAPKAKRARAPKAEQTPVGPTTTTEPTLDDIRRRAYERYLARGAGDGMDFEDWLDAERELRGQKVEGKRQKAEG